MSFFTCILILICIYVPWLVPVLFVLLLLLFLYHLSEILFWILIGGVVLFCVIALIVSREK